MRDMKDVRAQQRRRIGAELDEVLEEEEDELQADGEIPSLKGGVSDAVLLDDDDIDRMIAERDRGESS